MRLQIIHAGEEVLRVQARKLSREEILSEKIQELIEHMKETMRDAPGVGLAAPQVGISLQLAVIEDREEYQQKLTAEQLSERQREPVSFHVIINPRIINPGISPGINPAIVSSDSADVEFFEGCLSVPGYSAIVSRARSVTVEYLNESAEPKRVHAAGWYARILQHEIDHLNGILYVDRMRTGTWTTVDNLERVWKGLSIAEVQSRLRLGDRE
jgi:peptide deformylase